MISRIVSFVKSKLSAQQVDEGVQPKQFFVQCNYAFSADVDNWTICPGTTPFNNLILAIKSFNRHRIFVDRLLAFRIVDSDNAIYVVYNPEQNTQLNDNKQRMTEKLAHKLWEEAGCPEGDGAHFWYEAEQKLEENDGVICYEISPYPVLDEIVRSFCNRS